MDKEDVVHIYTMEYYSAIKKNKIGSFVDGSRVCHTKNIRKRKKKLYIKAYMWKREKWHRWTYFQGRSRDTDVENGHVDTAGRECGMNWDSRIDWYTSPLIASENLLYSHRAQLSDDEWLRSGTWGREGRPRGRGYPNVYRWFTSTYSRDEHNIVNQLHSNKNLFKQINFRKSSYCTEA